MKRIQKTYGLALAAVLVAGAIGASGATAQQGVVTSETGEAFTLTGTETGVEKNRVTAFGAFFECPGSTGVGHKADATPHQLVPDAATAFTLTPHIRQTDAEGNPNCKGPFGWTGTTDFNGCDYVATLGETIAEHEYGGSVDIVCPAGTEIQWTLWTSAVEHVANPTSPFCEMRVPAQKGISGARAIDTDTNDGHIELVGEVTGIEVTKIAVRPGHSFLCSQHETTQNAKLHIDATVSAHDALGDPAPIKLSD